MNWVLTLVEPEVPARWRVRSSPNIASCVAPGSLASVTVPSCSLNLRLDEFDNPTSLEVAMARNTGRGSRVGSVNAYSRSQMGSSTWSLREGTTGRFVEVKSTGGDLKGVRREK